MSEANNAGDGGQKPPSAATLAEAVVAALAQREEGAAPSTPSTEPSPATPAIIEPAAAPSKEDDSPVVSAVTIGGAIAVGAPLAKVSADEPELTVSSDAAPSEPPPKGDEPAAAPAPEPPAAPVAGAAPSEGNDELTSPRGLAANREVPEGVAIRYYGRTDVGLVREHNEDNFLVVDVSAARRGVEATPIDTKLGDRGCVLAVCDGMGGAAAGEVASQMAVDTIHEMMTSGGPPKDRDHFARRLVRAVEEAGSRIFAAAKMDRTRRGMGTTSTVAGLVDSTLFVGQVGDSRAYVLRGDQFALITKDQSLVNQLIEAGQLTEEEAEAFEHSNIILQALGTTEEVSVDLTFLELRRGDRLLLCSDGLSGLVHADMMKDVLRASPDLVQAAAQLIAMANAGGGHDNITVVLAEFDGVGLKEPSTDAKVAYQQYPLPPAAADANDAPPPRPAQAKAAAAKPGADVKHASPRVEEESGAGRWWIVAVLVLLVLALVGAMILSMDGGREAQTEAPTRTTLSGTAPIAPSIPAAPEPAHLRFGATGAYAGASLRIDGQSEGVLPSDSMVVDVEAGTHRVEVLREGVLVARAEVAVEAGHHEIVELEAVAPVAPVGVEPPPEMVALPEVPTPEPTEVARRPSEPRDDETGRGEPDGEGTERPHRRPPGDLAHEPPPRTTTAEPVGSP
jgi:protein phosphatase